jgi:hypothetical protein
VEPRIYIDDAQLKKPCYLLLKVYWFMINPAIEYNEVFSMIADIGFQLVSKQMGIPPLYINNAMEATEFINFKIQEGVVGFNGTAFYCIPPSDEELFLISQNQKAITDFIDPSIPDIQVSISSQTYFTMILCPRTLEPEVVARVSIFTSRYFLLWWFRPTRWLANILLNRKVNQINRLNKLSKKRFC